MIALSHILFPISSTKSWFYMNSNTGQINASIHSFTLIIFHWRNILCKFVVGRKLVGMLINYGVGQYKVSIGK